MSKQLRELQSRKAGLIKEARALTDRAAADNRDMNDEETLPRSRRLRQSASGTWGEGEA